VCFGAGGGIVSKFLILPGAGVEGTVDGAVDGAVLGTPRRGGGSSGVGGTDGN